MSKRKAESNQDKKVVDECPKGGRHEFETRSGGLGQTYVVCCKCGGPSPFTGHLGFS